MPLAPALTGLSRSVPLNRMNPLGISRLLFLALEGLACTLNPKLRKRQKRRAGGFGLVYAGVLLGGIVLIVLAVRQVYFRK